MLSSKAFDRNRDPNARFDFLGGQGLSKLFRLPKGAKFIEAKIRNSPDMQKSMFGKIKKHLDKLGLIFLGFEDQLIKENFKRNFTNKDDLFDLDVWEEYEKFNPRIFAGMYQFWCKKN